ncbi:SUMF1/EgtB/PvdO family nonheme iron enzyme [Candidatus Latescibacterota bacterium]
MKKTVILCIISLLVSCEKEPTNPGFSDMGDVRITIENALPVEKSAADSLNNTAKTTPSIIINQLEVRVLKSDNSLITSKTLLPVLGFFEGTIKVKVQDNLKVLCIGKLDGVVKRIGVDEDVDVKAGQTTTATIPVSQWNVSSIPVITDITPNPSNDGSYSVTWSTVPTGTEYTLQEANIQNFSDGRSVYTGTETQKVLSDKSDGTYYYRIMATNEYNVSSGWSETKSVVVDSTPTPFTISGTIAGGDGATVTLSGNASDTQIAGVDGSFSFTVSQGGTYTITPTKTDYTINPESQIFTNVTANQTANFTASYSPNLYSISGFVTGADSVLVTLSGDASGSLEVDNGGSYVFTVAEGGNYSITPSKIGYMFQPIAQTFLSISSDQTQNFTATEIPPNTYTISGTVSGADGVTMTLSGDKSEIMAVNDGAAYSFLVDQGGNYTVTPSKTGYTFTPASKNFTDVNSNQTQNFTATEIPATTYTISGTITGADGVTVTLSGDDSDIQIVTADGGSYSFTVEENGNYTITPSKTGYTFTPSSQTFNNITSNQILNFTATEIVAPNEITMVSIPAGSFEMGSNDGEEDEKPVHTVTLDYSFEMSVYEITQGQYQAVIGSNPSNGFGVGDYYPVYNLHWHDAIAFCNMLSDSEGLERCYNESTGACDFTKNGFRLPTEAEWEYACRAGTMTAYYTGDSESDLARAGWYDVNSSNVAHPVGQKTPNAWGLYDMHGNEWEWCNDWYGSYSSESATNPIGAQTSATRVFRGGGWGNNGGSSRSASRNSNTPYAGNVGIGFRVARGAFTPGYLISGTISGADGVTMTLSGDVSDSQIVDDGGSYSFTVEHGGNYTITPEEEGYTFSPASQTFSNVTANQTQNFTATQDALKEIIMVSIPTGNFDMGSNDGAVDEQPVHIVTFDYSFEMSAYEITQYQYETFAGDNPSYFSGYGNLPVEDVMRLDILKFCNLLSDNAGLERCYDEDTWACDFTKNGYRLPTEAEWEYACRAGTTTKYYTGDSESDLARAGWYESNSDEATHHVGQKEPNAWGLYDMHGNVYEWCHDWYGTYTGDVVNPIGADSGVQPVTRGGSFNYDANDCRSANREIYYRGGSISYLGFRVVKGAFTAGGTTYTISGTVTGADGVTITLSGDDSGSMVVNDGGSYSFDLDYDGSYTVTPSKAGYSFTPASQTFNNVISNQTQNFTATQITYTISGRIYGAAGVTVRFTGDATGSTYVSITGGNYFFTVAGGGSYTVTPSKTDHIFMPSSKTFSNINSDMSQDFTGERTDNPWDTVNISYVTISGGSFSMGSTLFDDEEAPVHTVTLTGFEMGIYEVTQGQYTPIAGSNPSNYTGDSLPVEAVSWWDAIRFCNALSEKSSLDNCYNEISGACDFSKNGFRLPTEAEWEYACRAGTSTKYYLGDSESDLASAGWYSGNSSDITHPAGFKTKNNWGLYDMHGNVREWCNDWYDADYYSVSPSSNPTGPSSDTSRRILRGGHYGSSDRLCAYSRRDSATPDYKTVTVGFRVVRRP